MASPAAPSKRPRIAAPRGRPVGTMGPVARAMLEAARQGPADVRTLAVRAGVGFKVASFTASRLQARGDLVAVNTGRPALLALPVASTHADTAVALALLQSWPRAPAPGSSPPEPVRA